MQRKHLLVLGVLVAALGFLTLPAAGLASGASLTWSPNSYDFMSVLPGQSASHTFMLTNSSASSISSSGMLSISLSGSGAAAYSITSNTCSGVALGRGKSCSVTVRFAPTTPAQSSYPAALVATGKKPAGGNATASLSGSAIRAPGLTLTKDNDANHDGTYSDTENVPTSAVYSYTVTYKLTISDSATSSAATITSISDNKVAAPLRSASTTDLDCADLIGIQIASGGTTTCFYDKTFTDGNTAQVVNTASVTLSNSVGSDSKTDTSTVNFPPQVDASVAFVQRSSVYGDANSGDFTLHNGGATAETVVVNVIYGEFNLGSLASTVAGGCQSAANLGYDIAWHCTVPIAAGATVTVAALHINQAGDFWSGTATIASATLPDPDTSNNTASGTVTFTPTPDLSLSPYDSDNGTDANGTKDYDYNNNLVTGGWSTTFTVTNSGTATSNTLSVDLSGDTVFSVGSDTCTGNTLAASGTCSFNITFTPAAGCERGDVYFGAADVNAQTNNTPYIDLQLQAFCP
jgi:hypothetical protein